MYEHALERKCRTGRLLEVWFECYLNTAECKLLIDAEWI
jgi:hypothetical protein